MIKDDSDFVKFMKHYRYSMAYIMILVTVLLILELIR